MSFAVLGLGIGGITITDAECVSKSFPGFWDILAGVYEMRRIVLTGFRGTGKTEIGKILASRLNVPLIDTDDLIETMTGRSIPDIFHDDGEERFRSIEREVIASLPCSGCNRKHGRRCCHAIQKTWNISAVTARLCSCLPILIQSKNG